MLCATETQFRIVFGAVVGRVVVVVDVVVVFVFGAFVVVVFGAFVVVVFGAFVVVVLPVGAVVVVAMVGTEVLVGGALLLVVLVGEVVVVCAVATPPAESSATVTIPVADRSAKEAAATQNNTRHTVWTARFMRRPSGSLQRRPWLRAVRPPAGHQP
jgi:hypothetical protein